MAFAISTASHTIVPTADNFRLAHDEAAQMMARLRNETLISEEDRRLLQDFYDGLEHRHALLNKGVKVTLPDDDEDETVSDDILDSELMKAAEFPAFLKTLDPGDDATKLLIEGSSRIVDALQTVEKGANFLANVPMQNVLETYERIKAHEERLKAGGAPVSLVNAKIYLSETIELEETVKAMIIMDMDMKAPTVEEISATR